MASLSYRQPNFMEIFPFIIFFGAMLLFLLDLRRTIRKRDLLLDEEKSLEPIHIEVGGGRFDWANYSPPYVKLRIYDEFLVLSYSKKILLRYEKIDSVESKGFLLWRWIRINHHDEKQPIKRVIFGTSSPDFLVALIQDKLRKKSTKKVRS